MAATEEMHMQMVHGLATVFSGVDHQAVAFGEAFVAGDFSGSAHQVAEQVFIVFAGFCE